MISKREEELREIPSLKRIEVTSKDEMRGLLSHMTHAVYPHDKMFGDFIPVQTYVDCPPKKVFEYMRHTRSLEEWTYSVRDLVPSEIEGVLVGYDKIGDHTKIYCKTESDPNSLVVDYHCAWDQGEDLWMIYLNRIVPAERVLNKPGSVIFWQNCHHPFYDKNPYPETAPKERPVWVGDFWDLFYAGHALELENLKRILEFRHHNNLPIGPID